MEVSTSYPEHIPHMDSISREAAYKIVVFRKIPAINIGDTAAYGDAGMGRCRYSRQNFRSCDAGVLSANDAESIFFDEALSIQKGCLYKYAL